MDITVYIAVALALLSAIAILLVVRSRKVFEQKTTTLTTLVDTWAEQKQQESGDVNFEPNLQRTINVDIRYVLFIIDKLSGATNLIDELDIRKSMPEPIRTEECVME